MAVTNAWTPSPAEIERPRDGFDEVDDVGTVNVWGCTPIPSSGKIEINVAEAFDDSTPRRLVLLTCHGGNGGTEYNLDVDRAEALGHLLICAAKSVRKMAAKLDEAEQRSLAEETD